MSKYYILNKNKQDSKSGSNHELHDTTPGACTRLPLRSNWLEVGYYNNCQEAMAAAKRLYPSMSDDIDGCYFCCEPCHNE